MTIPRTALSARPLSRAGVLVATALLVLLGILAPATRADAQATPDPDTPDGTVTMTIALGDHGAITDQSPITGSISVENGTGQELTAGRVSLAIDTTPLTDSSSVTAWINSGASSGTPTAVFSAPTDPIAGQNSLQTPVLSTSVVEDLRPGVYPVVAELTGATTDTDTAWDLSVRSVLTIRSDASAVTGLLVPITATPANGTLLTADELTTLTAADGALTAQLDAVAGTAAVLAVDPAIPAAIRVLGASAPASATAWLQRLEFLPNETFALQFGDADAATQAHAGLDALLEPTTLDTYMSVEDFPVEEGPASTPSPTPSPTETENETERSAVVLPTYEELTSLRGELDGVLWPRGDVTSDDLTAFAGYLGGDATTILPSTSAGDATGANVEVGDARVLLTDDALSQTMSAAAAEPDEDVREGLLAQANAALSFSGTPAGGILIGLERDETRTADALGAVIDVTDPASLAELRAADASQTSLTAEPDEGRASDLTDLLADESSLEAFSTILDDPQVLLAPERIRILRVLGVGLTDTAFDTAVADHRARTVDTLDAVSIVDPSAIQLVSANVSLPVWIRNDLPWPVHLNLEVRPSDPRIVIDPYTQVEALAQTNTRVLVPVEARVASGELQVRFTLSSPTGVPIGTSQTADVTVRAEWENIGLGILGGLIVLLLGFGLFRTIRRRRRDKASGGEDAEGAATEVAAPGEEER